MLTGCSIAGKAVVKQIEGTCSICSQTILVVLGFSHTNRGSYVHVPFNDIVYPIFTHSRRSKICFSVGLFFSVMKRKVKRDN